jgi:hypothetical protein
MLRLPYIRATPTWLRYSDSNLDPPDIVEWDGAALLELRDAKALGWSLKALPQSVLLS